MELGSETYDTIATNLAGDAVVAIGVFQRDGSNALEVSRAVSAALEEIKGRFPPGVELQVIVDEAENVRASIDQTVDSLRDAVLLVFLVLLLGLGNSRLALITAAAVPVALVGSSRCCSGAAPRSTPSASSAWCSPAAWWWTTPSW